MVSIGATSAEVSVCIADVPRERAENACEHLCDVAFSEEMFM